MAAFATKVMAYPALNAGLVAVSAGGDTGSPGDRSYGVFWNGSGASVTVTTTSFPNTNEWGAALADLQTVIPAGTLAIIGPLRASVHADPVTGLVGFTYSASASVQGAVVAM